jgi:hypothetical protein
MAITLNNAAAKVVRELTAPAGGVTAFTLKMMDTQDRPVVLPLATATSGVTFPALMEGGIDGAPIATTVACVHGAPLAWSTANSNFAEVATGSTANAQCLADAVITSGSTTASLILRFPAAFVAP